MVFLCCVPHVIALCCCCNKKYALRDKKRMLIDKTQIEKWWTRNYWAISLVLIIVLLCFSVVSVLYFYNYTAFDESMGHIIHTYTQPPSTTAQLQHNLHMKRSSPPPPPPMGTSPQIVVASDLLLNGLDWSDDVETGAQHFHARNNARMKSAAPSLQLHFFGILFLYFCTSTLLFYRVIILICLCSIVLLMFALAINCVFVFRKSLLEFILPWVEQFFKHMEEDVEKAIQLQLISSSFLRSDDHKNDDDDDDSTNKNENTFKVVDV